MDNNHHDEEQGLIPVLPQGFSYNSLGSGREEDRDDRTTYPNILDIYLAAEQHSFFSAPNTLCITLSACIIFAGVAAIFALRVLFAFSNSPYFASRVTIAE